MDYGPFVESELAQMQVTLRPYVIHIRSSHPLECGPYQILQVHQVNLIRTSIYDKSFSSTKLTTHLDHVSHCKVAFDKY